MNQNITAPAATDDELLAALAVSSDFTTVTSSAHLAELLGVEEDTEEEADDEELFATDCQDNDAHGLHSARFSHVNQYGQKIYTVVCCGYEERYSDEAVFPVSTPVAERPCEPGCRDCRESLSRGARV